MAIKKSVIIGLFLCAVLSFQSSNRLEANELKTEYVIKNELAYTDTLNYKTPLNVQKSGAWTSESDEDVLEIILTNYNQQPAEGVIDVTSSDTSITDADFSGNQTYVLNRTTGIYAADLPPDDIISQNFPNPVMNETHINACAGIIEFFNLHGKTIAFGPVNHGTTRFSLHAGSNPVLYRHIGESELASPAKTMLVLNQYATVYVHVNEINKSITRLKTQQIKSGNDYNVNFSDPTDNLELTSWSFSLEPGYSYTINDTVHWSEKEFSLSGTTSVGASVRCLENGVLLAEVETTNGNIPLTSISERFDANAGLRITMDIEAPLADSLSFEQTVYVNDNLNIDTLLNRHFIGKLDNILAETNVKWKNNEGDILAQGTLLDSLFYKSRNDSITIYAILEKTTYINDTIHYNNIKPGTTTKQAPQMTGKYTTNIENALTGTNIKWLTAANEIITQGEDVVSLYQELPTDSTSIKAILELTNYVNDTIQYNNIKPGTTTKTANQIIDTLTNTINYITNVNTGTAHLVEKGKTDTTFTTIGTDGKATINYEHPYGEENTLIIGAKSQGKIPESREITAVDDNTYNETFNLEDIPINNTYNEKIVFANQTADIYDDGLVFIIKTLSDNQEHQFNITNTEQVQELTLEGPYETNEAIETYFTSASATAAGKEDKIMTIIRNYEQPSASNGTRTTTLTTTLNKLFNETNDTTWILSMNTNTYEDEAFKTHLNAGKEWVYSENEKRTMNINEITREVDLDQGTYGANITTEELTRMQDRTRMFDNNFWERNTGLKILNVNFIENPNYETTAGNINIFYDRTNIQPGNGHSQKTTTRPNTYDQGIGFVDYFRGELTEEVMQAINYVEDYTGSCGDIISNDGNGDPVLHKQEEIIVNMTYVGGQAPDN